MKCYKYRWMLRWVTINVPPGWCNILTACNQLLSVATRSVSGREGGADSVVYSIQSRREDDAYSVVALFVESPPRSDLIVIRGIENFSSNLSSAETVGGGIGGMNLSSENGEQGSGSFFVEDENGGVFVVDENWVEKGVVGDEGLGDSGCDKDSGDVFFVDDENGGTFLVGQDWEENNAERDRDEGENILIHSEDDILNMGDLSVFSPHEIENYEFSNMEVAFKFYFEYGKANGFGIQRGRTLRSRKTLEEYQKEFMCCRAGVREDRGLKMEDRVGIRPPNIFSTFASQSGGYEKIRFRKKDMYNKINEQRRKVCSDAKGVVQYLGEIRLNDNMMYFEHTVDPEGRLQHLFWSDGISQIDYKLYGEVLDFDAMYGKNKYFMPLVVFSGVNNHNRSTIFVAAIIANEIEETYVWVLEQFSKAMKGKLPNAVITDGDVAMKNAIERVFPNAYHCLCAWNLMRNATSNVKNADFSKAFENCMLGYYNVGTFRKKWSDLVSNFGLEDNPWGFIVGSSWFYTSSLMHHIQGWDAGLSARRAALNGFYNQVSGFKAATMEKYNAERQRLLADLRQCKAEKETEHESSCNGGNDMLRNPLRAATKGNGVACSSSGIRVRRKQNCSICKLPGHNKLTCPTRGNVVSEEDYGVGPSHATQENDGDAYFDFDPEQCSGFWSAFTGRQEGFKPPHFLLCFNSSNSGNVNGRCKCGMNVCKRHGQKRTREGGLSGVQTTR
ncbi:MULE transposase domain [Sesbania bispinosa]|nr:MULE transposase domain [Sesbania bispinosa]